MHNNGHFVLLTGFTDSESFTVNDPNYNTTAYPYANISDIIMYRIVPAPAAAPAAASAPAGDVVADAASSQSTPSRLRARLGRVHAKKQQQQKQHIARPAVSADAIRAASPDRAVASPFIPYAYPLYKQCDPSWGNNLMITETICSVGCLMSSTSMAIGRNNVTIANATSNPGTLNAFLRAHGGCVPYCTCLALPCTAFHCLALPCIASPCLVTCRGTCCPLSLRTSLYLGLRLHLCIRLLSVALLRGAATWATTTWTRMWCRR